MTDGYVTHQPESTGKKIETEQRINYAGDTVQRQTINVGNTVAVGGTTLDLVLLELRVISTLLALGLDLSINVDNLRRALFTSQVSN